MSGLGIIIGLAGRAHAGKDTAASIIINALPAGAVRVVRFADPAKRICREVFGWTEQHTDGPLKETPDPRFKRQVKCELCGESRAVALTPRHALQTLGTDWGRACAPDLWAQCGVRAAAKVLLTGTGAEGDCGPRVVVMPDMRFANEAQAVAEYRGQTGERCGFVWRVSRPGEGPVAKDHPSEREIFSPGPMDPFVDWDLANDSTVSDLAHKVRRRLAGLGLAVAGG